MLLIVVAKHNRAEMLNSNRRLPMHRFHSSSPPNDHRPHYTNHLQTIIFLTISKTVAKCEIPKRQGGME